MRTLPLLIALALVPGPLRAQAPDAAAPRIPLIAGLTLTGAVASDMGDYEPIIAVQSMAADSYRMTFSMETPGSDGRSIEVTRRVLLDDQRNARTMRNWYGEGDPESFPGTTPFFSAAIVNDLRKSGQAAITLLVARQAFALSSLQPQKFSGTVSRIDPGPVGVPVIVNGRQVSLPTIHARAEVSAGAERKQIELNVLDDPDNPIILRWRDETRQSKLVKADFPEPASTVERALTERKKVEVYGIYFAFGSATIRPQSERTLKEIADALAKNPDWRLRVDGHTDSIGGDAANLDLSRRRSAAVKSALVTRYGIVADRLTTGGSGEGAPRDTNDTAEGRALNRRVELTRQ